MAGETQHSNEGTAGLEKGWLLEQARMTINEVENWPPHLKEAATKLAGVGMEAERSSQRIRIAADMLSVPNQ